MNSQWNESGASLLDSGFVNKVMYLENKQALEKVLLTINKKEINKQFHKLNNVINFKVNKIESQW